jgi:hypothetical protein
MQEEVKIETNISTLSKRREIKKKNIKIKNKNKTTKSSQLII